MGLKDLFYQDFRLKEKRIKGKYIYFLVLSSLFSRDNLAKIANVHRIMLSVMARTDMTSEPTQGLKQHYFPASLCF